MRVAGRQCLQRGIAHRFQFPLRLLAICQCRYTVHHRENIFGDILDPTFVAGLPRRFSALSKFTSAISLSSPMPCSAAHGNCAIKKSSGTIFRERGESGGPGTERCLASRPLRSRRRGHFLMRSGGAPGRLCRLREKNPALRPGLLLSRARLQAFCVLIVAVEMPFLARKSVSSAVIVIRYPALR